MFSRFSRLPRYAAAIALSLAIAAAALLTPVAPSAHAASSLLDQQAIPIVAGALDDDVREIKKADLVVLFQGVEQHFYGTVWTYTVANAMPNPAQNVVVTKHFKMVQSGSQNMLAAPITQNLGTLGAYEVRWITITCSNQTEQKHCTGTGLSAKTSTPEVLMNNNSASHSFQ